MEEYMDLKGLKVNTEKTSASVEDSEDWKIAMCSMWKSVGANSIQCID